MEEKKNKQGQDQEKLSYESLKKTAADLYQQNMRLQHQLEQFDATSFILSMLFKVMDHKENYDNEFVDWVKKNIQGALTTFMEQFGEQENKDEDEHAHTS